MNKTQLLQGTLDLLILRILELGPNHGWGISNRLQQISKDGLKTSQGSLYPAFIVSRLRGEVKSEMTASENNRRARVYTITRAGRKRLNQETERWEAFALSMRRVLGGGPRSPGCSPRCADFSVDAGLTARSPKSCATISSARSRCIDRAGCRLNRHVVSPPRSWRAGSDHGIDA
jgi:transcriptional regulator